MSSILLCAILIIYYDQLWAWIMALLHKSHKWCLHLLPQNNTNKNLQVFLDPYYFLISFCTQRKTPLLLYLLIEMFFFAYRSLLGSCGLSAERRMSYDTKPLVQKGLRVFNVAAWWCWSLNLLTFCSVTHSIMRKLWARTEYMISNLS